MKTFLKTLSKSVALSIALLVICGFIFPLALTGVSQLIFPKQANGSIIEINGEPIGSEIVGQDFTDPRFLKCRPSAVGYNTYTEEDLVPDANGDTAYGGVASGSQNLAPSNPDLKKRVEEDIDTFLAANPDIKKEDIPTDLMTASGSGLDPHISPDSAAVQLPALAKANGLTQEALQIIVDDNTTKKILGIFGEATVNVLKVNLEIAKALSLV